MAKFELTNITGVIVAMITMFDENEEVDIRGTNECVDFLLEQDIDGFYVTVITGDGFLMTVVEGQRVEDPG